MGTDSITSKTLGPHTRGHSSVTFVPFPSQPPGFPSSVLALRTVPSLPSSYVELYPTDLYGACLDVKQKHLGKK